MGKLIGGEEETMLWVVCNNIFVGNSVGGDPHAILPLLHLTGVHMSKSTVHWSPSLNYFMVLIPPPVIARACVQSPPPPPVQA
jgi:hypothetical protein